VWFRQEVQAVPRAPVVTTLSSDTSIYTEVAAGILADSAGRVLLAERTSDSPFRGMWEFPGGKVACGETSSAALIRELREELGIEASDFAPFMTIEHDYADRSVRLHFFEVREWKGEPQGLDGQKLRWALPAEIDTESLLPADAPVIAALLA
jgi:8-oxo-dGTP diphosphatase